VCAGVSPAAVGRLAAVTRDNLLPFLFERVDPFIDRREPGAAARGVTRPQIDARSVEHVVQLTVRKLDQ
jgi:hypothetical protein